MIVAKTVVLLFVLLFLVLPLTFMGLLSLTGACSFELQRDSLIQRTHRQVVRLFSAFIGQ